MVEEGLNLKTIDWSWPLSRAARACRICQRTSGIVREKDRITIVKTTRLLPPTPLLIPGHVYWQWPPRKIFMNKSRYQPVNPKSLTVHRILAFGGRTCIRSLNSRRHFVV